jgi:hypothetical protein
MRKLHGAVPASNHVGDRAGPACLMRGSQACAVVTVKEFGEILAPIFAMSPTES